MTLAQMDQVKTAWPSLAEALHVPHSEQDYQALVELLDRLVDEGARMKTIRWLR